MFGFESEKCISFFVKKLPSAPLFQSLYSVRLKLIHKELYYYSALLNRHAEEKIYQLSSNTCVIMWEQIRIESLTN
jgi:hypothetical protein